MNKQNEFSSKFKAGVLDLLYAVNDEMKNIYKVMSMENTLENITKKIEIEENRYLIDNLALKDVEERQMKEGQQLDRILNMQEAIIEELNVCSKQFIRPQKYYAINLLDGTDEREALNGKARMATRCLKDTQDLVNSNKNQLSSSHYLAELEKLEMQIVRVK